MVFNSAAPLQCLWVTKDKSNCYFLLFLSPLGDEAYSCFKLENASSFWGKDEVIFCAWVKRKHTSRPQGKHSSPPVAKFP